MLPAAFAAVGSTGKLYLVYPVGWGGHSIGDGTYAHSLIADGVIATASGAWPHPVDAGILGALAGGGDGGPNVIVYNDEPFNGGTRAVTATFTPPPVAACLWSGKLLTSASHSGLGDESRLSTIALASVGTPVSVGSAWTHCAVGEDAFVLRADGGIDLYRSSPQSRCLITFADGGAPSGTGQLLQGLSLLGPTLFALRPGGVSQFLQAADAGCTFTQLDRPELAGNYRAVGLANFDGVDGGLNFERHREDLVLLNEDGGFRVDWH